MRAPLRLQPACGSGKEREKGAEDERRQRRHRRRHAANVVHADVDPGDAGAEETEPESEAEPCAVARRS
jgi:hypothetical protein